MIFKQPNGLYGRVSNIVEAPTHTNLTELDLKDYLTETNQWDFAGQTLEEWLAKHAVSLFKAIGAVSELNMGPTEYLKWLSEIF